MTPRVAAKLAGRVRYFTGKPCKHGHVAERNTATGTCTACMTKFVRAYERRHFGKVVEATRRYHLRKNYGLTTDQYNDLLAVQNNSCAICKSPDPFDRWGRFHVDHDHATGKVRGLLCGNCNTGLGKMKDSITNLQAAIAYLENGE